MLRIISGYREGMEEYLRAARKAPAAELSALHMKHVLHDGGVWDGCIAGSLADQYQYWKTLLGNPIRDLDRLAHGPTFDGPNKSGDGGGGRFDGENAGRHMFDVNAGVLVHSGLSSDGACQKPTCSQESWLA